ncbi:MAG TPA: hypothetical protein VF986_07535 [Actinomycetota bacterium]
MGGTSWRRWKYLSAVAVCFLFAWIAFVRKAQVPLLSLVDLGFHELGHLVTRPLPEVIMIAAGSFAQIAVPVGLAAYFLLRRKDRLGGALCLAWAATSAKDVAAYVADAPSQRLQLIGGEHDWAAILGPDHFNALDRAELIAAAVRWFGIALLFAALAICVWTIVLDDAPMATADRGGRTAGDGWAWSGVRR